jgi:hypothetical protein
LDVSDERSARSVKSQTLCGSLAKTIQKIVSPSLSVVVGADSTIIVDVLVVAIFDDEDATAARAVLDRGIIEVHCSL